MKRIAILIVLGLVFLSAKQAQAQQLQTNSNTIETRIGNPQSQPSKNSSGVISWTEKISAVLEIGYDGSYDKMVSQISNGSYTTAQSPGTSSANKYWCTYLVIDSYNLAGFSGTSRQNHGGAVNLMNYFRGNAGYKFLDYYSGSHSSALSQAKPGYAIFFQAVPGSTTIGSFDHAAIIKSINVNTHGDGTLETYDANISPASGGKVLSYPVDSWTIKGLLTSPSTYSVMGFGTTQ